MVRLASLSGRAAAEALATIVRREAGNSLGLAAFLALVGTQRAQALDIEDLTADGYGPDYLWRRLAVEPASAEGAAAVAGDSVVRSRSFSERVNGGRGHLVHKIRAKDTTGRWAYYFVMVSPSRDRQFLNAIVGEGTIDLAHFGQVIASSYGEAPSTEVVDQLKTSFGLDVA